MRAVVIGSHGGPEVVSVTNLPEPQPKSGQVRVAVRTAALNHLDLWVRGGLPGLNLTFPHVMGSDCAGVIDQLGPDVEGFQIGDEVVLNPGISCGICRHCRAGEQSQCADFHLKGEHFDGTFCEYIAVSARNLAPRPQRLSWEASAAFPLVGLSQIRLLQVGARQVGMAEIHPGQPGALQLSIPGVHPPEAATGEVRPLEASIPEIGPSQSCCAEVGPRKDGPAQCRFGEIGITQADGPSGVELGHAAREIGRH